MKSIVTSSLSKTESEKITSLLNAFIKKWEEITTLNDVAIPDGTGIVDDIVAIDYVIYEGMQDVFFESIDSFAHTGAALLGNFLVKNNRFQWCEYTLCDKKTIGLKHLDCSVLLPIRELVIYKYSGLPQFGTFETLFFDILFSEIDIEQTYPLIDAHLITMVGEKTFEERHGYDIPKDVMELYQLYSLPDEMYLIRQLGIYVYDYCKLQNWQRLKYEIQATNYTYKRIYGEDWQSRYKNENETLFRTNCWASY